MQTPGASWTDKKVNPHIFSIHETKLKSVNAYEGADLRFGGDFHLLFQKCIGLATGKEGTLTSTRTRTLALCTTIHLRRTRHNSKHLHISPDVNLLLASISLVKSTRPWHFRSGIKIKTKWLHLAMKINLFQIFLLEEKYPAKFLKENLLTHKWDSLCLSSICVRD